jgi:hypothetical protein
MPFIEEHIKLKKNRKESIEETKNITHMAQTVETPPPQLSGVDTGMFSFR